MNDNNAQQSSTLYTIKQFSQKHPAFSERSLRWLIYKSEENGLSKTTAIKRIGKKIIIDEDLFFDWIEQQQ